MRGRIIFDGADITGSNRIATCELGIGQVAEGRQIFPNLTVEENLQLGGALRRSRKFLVLNRERIFAMFPRLAERRRQMAGTLSGGEQQMLAIGRCLMSNPRFIMFDEPSLGLAPVIVEFIFAAILELKNAGVTILLIEQNVSESLALANLPPCWRTARSRCRARPPELPTMTAFGRPTSDYKRPIIRRSRSAANNSSELQGILGSSSAARSLWSRNVPKRREIQPTFQRWI